MDNSLIKWYGEVYEAVGGTDKDLLMFLLNTVTALTLQAFYGNEDASNDFIRESVRIYNGSKGE